jgi:hypothetical protein
MSLPETKVLEQPQLKYNNRFFQRQGFSQKISNFFCNFFTRPRRGQASVMRVKQSNPDVRLNLCLSQ